MFGDEPPSVPVLPDSPPAIVRTADDIPPPALPANIILTRVPRTSVAVTTDNQAVPQNIAPEMNRASTVGVTGELVRRPGFRGYDLVNQDGVAIGAGLFKDESRSRTDEHRMPVMSGQPTVRSSGLGLSIQIRLGGN